MLHEHSANKATASCTYTHRNPMKRIVLRLRLRMRLVMPVLVGALYFPHTRNPLYLMLHPESHQGHCTKADIQGEKILAGSRSSLRAPRSAPMLGSQARPPRRTSKFLHTARSASPGPHHLQYHHSKSIGHEQGRGGHTMINGMQIAAVRLLATAPAFPCTHLKQWHQLQSQYQCRAELSYKTVRTERETQRL